MPSGVAAPGCAHGRLRRALLLRARAASPSRGRDGCRATPGRDPTRSCARSSTSSGGGSAATYRVLVDANQHVDREGAARAGIGFYGKNTLLITRRYGSWVVLGTLVTDGGDRVERPARARLRLVPPLHRRLPDGRARRARRARLDALPLLLDTGARLRSPRVSRRARRAGLRLRHLPGRLSVEPRAEKRSAAAEPAAGAEPRRVARRLARGVRRGAARSATTGCTSRATTRATCAATRSWRRGTPVIRRCFRR